MPPPIYVLDAFSALNVAEVEFLRASGWAPLAPESPGGEIRWRRKGSGIICTQDFAVAHEKGEIKKALP